MNDSRSALRSRLLADRRALDVADQRQAALEISDRIIDRVETVTSQGRIAGYLSYGAELDLRPCLDALIDRGHEVVLPVCGLNFSVEFCPWRPGDPMRSGLYGIEEPLSEPVAPNSIALVLVPGVGFGVDGSRIGHGAGYYDRYFARCFALDHDPRRLGVAHDLQVVDLPPPEPWDVGMHEIITPSKVIHVTH